MTETINFGIGTSDSSAITAPRNPLATSTVDPHPATPVAPSTAPTPRINTPSGTVNVDNMGNMVSQKTTPPPGTQFDKNGDIIYPGTQQTNPTSLSNAPAGSYQKMLYDAQQAKLANHEAATNLQGTNSNGFISSSTGIVNGENNIGASVDNAVAEDPNMTKTHNDAISMLATHAANLQAQYAAEQAQINASFDTAKGDLQKNQKNENDANTVSLQRTGGYLGEGSSQVGAMVRLNETHQTELSNLEGKRAEALQAASKAKNAGDFEVAKLKLSEAQQYSKDVQDRKEKYFSDMLQLQQSQREQGVFDMNKAQDTLKGLSSLTPEQLSSVPKDTLDQIDKT